MKENEHVICGDTIQSLGQPQNDQPWSADLKLHNSMSQILIKGTLQCEDPLFSYYVKKNSYHIL